MALPHDEAILAKRLEEELGERAGDYLTVADAEDISAGVEQELKDCSKLTFYVHVADAIDITVEMSPDGGGHWFEIPESPLSYGGAGDDVLEVGYSGNRLRITGSNTTATTFVVRETF